LGRLANGHRIILVVFHSFSVTWKMSSVRCIGTDSSDKHCRSNCNADEDLLIRQFGDIIAVAAKCKGGLSALEDALAATPASLLSTVAAIPDDRILAEMSRWIFYAGFSARVVDAKWLGFEKSFSHFDLRINAYMDNDRLDELSRDPEIVRNGPKIRAVRANARLLLDFASSDGSAAHFFAQWPDEDYVGLLYLLKEQGSYLSGHAAMRFLRAIGKTAFILIDDVVDALIRENVIAGAPRTRKDRTAVQAAFNIWSQQSGRNLTEISRILAISVGEISGRLRR